MGRRHRRRAGHTGPGGTGSPAQGVVGLSEGRREGRLDRVTGLFQGWRGRGWEGGHPAPCCAVLCCVVLRCVWCGVVWRVMWCGVVWCGVVWCDVVWCGVVWCGVVWCGVVWCGVVWCGVVWCGVVCSIRVRSACGSSLVAASTRTLMAVIQWCGVVGCGACGCAQYVMCSAVHTTANHEFHMPYTHHTSHTTHHTPPAHTKYRGVKENPSLQILVQQNPCHFLKMSAQMTQGWQTVRNGGRLLLFPGGLSWCIN